MTIIRFIVSLLPDLYPFRVGLIYRRLENFQVEVITTDDTVYYRHECIQREAKAWAVRIGHSRIMTFVVASLEKIFEKNPGESRRALMT